MKRTYLDWASATPVSAAATRVFARAAKAYGNPSSPHAEGRAARARLEEARREIATLVEAKADDVVFTSGATEANALAMRGHVQARIAQGRAPETVHLLYLPTAHSSIVKNAEALAREGVLVEPLPITKRGKVDIAVLRALIRPETVLVSMDAVCGETGIIWNARAVRHVLEEVGGANRPLLHVDASQAAYTERITRSHWGADLLVLDAQKVGGVRGIGALVAHRTISIEPLVAGGSQERGVRPGTEPVALAAAFAAALAETLSGREVFHAHAGRMRERLLAILETIPDCLVNAGKDNAPHIVNVSFLGRDTDYLAALLDEAGFATATRSACETDAAGSHVVRALTHDDVRALSTLRISWGSATRARDLTQAAHAISRAVAFLDENNI